MDKENEPRQQSFRMSRATFVHLESKVHNLKERREQIINGLSGEDYTSGLHDEPSVVRELQQTDTDLTKIAQILKSAEILPTRKDTSQVGVGNRLKLLFLGENQVETFQLGTPIDASYSPQKGQWISSESPLGKALAGKKEKDSSFYEKPGGGKVRVKIEEILPEE